MKWPLQPYTHSKLAQLTATCNPDSNIGSLSNQRVRSSLNYRWRRIIAHIVARTVTRSDVRDYQYVASALADYLTSRCEYLLSDASRWLQIQSQRVQTNKNFLGEHAPRPS